MMWAGKVGAVPPGDGTNMPLGFISDAANNAVEVGRTANKLRRICFFNSRSIRLPNWLGVNEEPGVEAGIPDFSIKSLPILSRKRLCNLAKFAERRGQTSGKGQRV